jgi:hypothetical protein
MGNDGAGPELRRTAVAQDRLAAKPVHAIFFGAVVFR